MQEKKQIPNIVIRVLIIAIILAAGWFAVFNIPDAVESLLPQVETITLRAVEYQPCVSGSGVITQTPQGDWHTTVSIAERDIRKVRVGQSATLTSAAFDDNLYTATVYDIGTLAVVRQVEFGRETVIEVVLQIDNPDISDENRLRSGNTARATIHTGELQSIFVLPYCAIMQDSVGEYVFVLEGHSVTRRDIITGAELSDGAQILEGLDLDDFIIANPNSVEENSLAVREV